MRYEIRKVVGRVYAKCTNRNVRRRWWSGAVCDARPSVGRSQRRHCCSKSTSSTSYRIKRVVSHNRYWITCRPSCFYCILIYFIVEYNIIKYLRQAAAHDNIILLYTRRRESLVFFGFYNIIETRLVTPPRRPRAHITSEPNRNLSIVSKICSCTYLSRDQDGLITWYRVETEFV